MRIRRAKRARHAKADSEDLVIDLRELLAPYEVDEASWNEHADATHANHAGTGLPKRRARPVRR